jgi:hypothetical protein
MKEGVMTRTVKLLVVTAVVGLGLLLPQKADAGPSSVAGKTLWNMIYMSMTFNNDGTFVFGLDPLSASTLNGNWVQFEDGYYSVFAAVCSGTVSEPGMPDQTVTMKVIGVHFLFIAIAAGDCTVNGVRVGNAFLGPVPVFTQWEPPMPVVP